MKATEVRAGLRFPHAVQITCQRRPHTGGPTETETVRAVTSLPIHQASPAQLADLARDHWTVENQLRGCATSLRRGPPPGPHWQQPPRDGQPTQPRPHRPAPDRHHQHRPRAAPPRPPTRTRPLQTITSLDYQPATLPAPWPARDRQQAHPRPARKGVDISDIIHRDMTGLPYPSNLRQSRRPDTPFPQRGDFSAERPTWAAPPPPWLTAATEPRPAGSE